MAGIAQPPSSFSEPISPLPADMGVAPGGGGSRGQSGPLAKPGARDGPSDAIPGRLPRRRIPPPGLTNPKGGSRGPGRPATQTPGLLDQGDGALGVQLAPP